MTRRPHALLFDLDDTLWPIAPVIATAEQSWHDWLAQRVPQLTERYSIAELRRQRMALLERQPELIVDLYQLRRVALAQVLQEIGSDLNHLEGAMAHFAERRNAVTPYADVAPGLATLQSLLPLGVVTNGNADLGVIGLHQHFKVNLAACRFGRAKPDPAIFHAACAELGVEPAHAVYVGDDLRLDVQGAQRAGLRAVWMRRSDVTAAPLEGVQPDAICQDLHDLVQWVQGQMQH